MSPPHSFPRPYQHQKQLYRVVTATGIYLLSGAPTTDAAHANLGCREMTTLGAGLCHLPCQINRAWDFVSLS